MPEPRWIRFAELGPKPGAKTNRWRVETKPGGQELGLVLWGTFRKYEFCPLPGTAYEEDCLSDIAAFLADQTRRYRALRQHHAEAIHA